jgi:hypothetical protein
MIVLDVVGVMMDNRDTSIIARNLDVGVWITLEGRKRPRGAHSRQI